MDDIHDRTDSVIQILIDISHAEDLFGVVRFPFIEGLLECKNQVAQIDEDRVLVIRFIVPLGHRYNAIDGIDG